MDFHSAGRVATLALGLVLGGGALAAPGLQLDASPRQLLAGRDEAAILTLRGADQPRDVKLTCTAGTVRGLRRVGPQQLRAEYVPPRSGAATWVLCGAVGNGAAALLSLELQRREMLALTGLPPLSRVLVKMGEALYGPVRANAEGYVEVPVTLTPAVPSAEIQATPPGKPTETRREALSVVTPSQVLLMAAGTEVVADGTQSLPVWAFTLGERGEPQEVAVAFAATEGTLAMTRAGPGLWAGELRPPGRTAPGEATLTARLPSGHSSSIRVELLQGLHPRLALEGPGPEEPLLADGATTVELRVRASDQEGRPLAGQPIRLTAERGQVGTLQERAPGLYAAPYTVPSGAVGPVKVSAELAGADTAALSLHLQAPPRLTLEVSPHQLPADGRSRAQLLITARDPQGRELPEGTPVLVSTTLGTVPAKVPTSGGRARVELVAGRTAGDALIAVSALDATASTSVRLVPGAPAKLQLRSDHPVVQCDGRDSTDLHLFVRDENDNGLEGVHIEMALAGRAPGQEGHLDRVAALGKGEFIVRYHAPDTCTPGLLKVAATAEDVHGETQLQLARSYPRIMGLTVRVGGEDNLSRLYSSTLELEGDGNIGFLPDQLLASATVQVGYGGLTAPLQGDSSYAGYTGRYQLLITSLAVGPRWTFLELGRLSAYAGVGIGAWLAYVNGALAPPGDPSHPIARDSTVAPLVVGLDARVGVGYWTGPGQMLLQARYGYAELNAPLLKNIQLAGLAVSVGYRISF